MATADATRSKSSWNESPSLAETNTLMWGIFLVGLVVGFVGVYLVVAQPMLAQLEGMQRQLTTLQSGTDALVGVRDQVWETSNLMTGVAAQHKQVKDVRGTLLEIRQLRQDLLAEREHLAGCFSTLNQLVKIQDTLIEQREVAATAAKSLTEIAEVQQRLVKEHGITPQAQATLADLAETKTGLAELIRIKQQIIDETGNLPEAKKAANELIGLKQDLVTKSDDVETARTVANKLLSLQNELTSHAEELKSAFSSLDGLLEIKGKLIDNTPQVAEAIQNLELFNDFQEEFSERIRSLGPMRQSLMELVMLETAVGRVARVIEPLVQIANIRRLSDTELRDAARTILEKRGSTRISNKNDADKHLPSVEADPFHENLKPTTEKAATPVPLPLNDD